MMENWKDIDGFDGYQVSDKGRVRSHNKITRSARFERREWKDRILKQKIGKDNSCRVSLWKDGKEYTRLVHRLEAVAFLGGSYDSEMTVNHIDGNRLNNNIENIEWMTRSDNIREGFRTGLYRGVQKQCRLVCVDTGETLDFPSFSEASRYLGHYSGYCYCRAKREAVCYDRDTRAAYRFA